MTSESPIPIPQGIPPTAFSVEIQIENARDVIDTTGQIMNEDGAKGDAPHMAPPPGTEQSTPPTSAGPPPQAKVVGIFVVICLYFSLIIAPFLGAAANPDRNIARFTILVADFDGGFLGQGLAAFYTQSLSLLMPTIAAKLGGTSQALPTFTMTTASATASDLQTRVHNNEAWAGTPAEQSARIACSLSHPRPCRPPCPAQPSTSTLAPARPCWASSAPVAPMSWTTMHRYAYKHPYLVLISPLSRPYLTLYACVWLACVGVIQWDHGTPTCISSLARFWSAWMTRRGRPLTHAPCLPTSHP